MPLPTASQRARVMFARTSLRGEAGFAFDVATVSGNPVKFELWAMPHEDKAITGLYEEYLDRFQKPHKLSDIADALGPGSGYVVVFIPGGRW